MADKINKSTYEKLVRSFRDLRRLFQNGPVVKHRVAQKISDPGSSNIAPVGTAAAFLKNNSNVFASQMASYGDYNRLARYSDYQEMESMAEINGALDIYADEATSEGPSDKIIQVDSDNPHIKQTLINLFYDTLNIEFEAWEWIRNMVKYGDQFLFIDYNPDYGVIGLYPLPVNEVVREEGYDENNPLAIRFRWQTQGNRVLEFWQVLHLRIKGNSDFLPYGSSLLEGARRVWRQLILMEDAVMVYRIVRCLAGDSEILTNDGVKQIKDIKIGDYVYSYNKDSGQLELSKVTDFVNNGSQQIWEIESKRAKLRTNFNHPVLVKDCETGEISYIQTNELVPNKHQMIMPGEDEFFEDIVSVKATKQCEDVYDIRVDSDLHNFIANGCVVHNSPERRVFYIDVGAIDPNDVGKFMEKAQTQLKRNQVVDSNSGRVDLRYNPLCHFPNDFAYLADGTRKTVKELAQNWNENKNVYVWSLDENHNIVPSKLVWAGKTRENAKFTEVKLDDGQTIRTTPNHRWVLRDGSLKKAEDLKPGDKLMPLYCKKDTKLSQRHSGKNKKNFYTTMYQPSTGKWETGHKIVGRWKYGEYKFPDIIHHVDHVKYNNSPDNLEKMTQSEHAKLHEKLSERMLEYSKSDFGRKKSSETMKKAWKSGKINNNTFTELWKDKDIRKKRIEKLTFKVDSTLIKFVGKAINELGFQAREHQIRDYLNNDAEFVEYLEYLNKDFKNGFNNQLTKVQFLKALRYNNFNGIEDVKLYYALTKAPWDLIVKYCQENKVKSRKQIIRHFGISKNMFNKIVARYDLTLKEFDEKYMNGGYYRPHIEKRCMECNSTFLSRVNENKIYCSHKCYSLWLSGQTHESIREARQEYMNHTVVSVKESDIVCDAYGLTVENSTHVLAIGGEDSDTLPIGHKERSGVPKSGVFLKNSTDEDYFIPVRGQDTGTRVENLPGGQFTGDIEDLNYIQSKLFAALKVPKSYLGYEDAIGKSTLSQEDIRFSKTVQRIQRVFLAELNRVAIVHLYAAGYRDEDLVNFELKMANPSNISELQKLELFRTRIEVATMGVDNIVDRHYIYKKLLNLDDEEIAGIEEGRKRDRLLDQEIEGIGTEDVGAEGGGEEPAAGGESPETVLPEPSQESRKLTPKKKGQDPNQQKGAPNELVKVKKPRKKHSNFPDLYNHVTNSKKNALSDPGDKAHHRRKATSPFGEAIEDPVFELQRKKIDVMQKKLENLDKNFKKNPNYQNKVKKVIKD